MIENNIPQNLVDKIHKLIALRDNAGTPAESENAAMRISEILMKYNLDMETVQSQGATKKEVPVEEIRTDLNELQSKTEANWVASLYGVIARYNLCMAIHNTSRAPGNQGTITIIGKKHNIEIVDYLVGALITMIRTAEKKTYSTYQGIEKRNTFRRGFLRGCVSGIKQKLAEQEREQINSLEIGKQVNALMVVNSRQLQEYVDIKFGRLKQGTSTRLSGQSGLQMGRAAGYGMKVGAGLNAAGPGQRRLS